MPRLTKKEQASVDIAIAQLKEHVANQDYEAAHVRADHTVESLLRELGLTEVANQYSKVGKYYA